MSVGPTVAPAAKPEKFLHGNNGALSIVATGGGETEFQITNFDGTVSVAAEDITHSGADGWHVVLAGTRVINGTVTFVYDMANQPFISPYELKVASKATVKVYQNHHPAANLSPADANGSEVWGGLLFVQSFALKIGPKAGPQECTFTFVSSDPWTGPSIAQLP